MAVEFAIVFPLFFLVFYAIVTYSMIFVAQQSLTLAASEGARAALRYQTG
ncbi:pilus assembly protein TadE, partial [Caballeronia mineralivorans PML1(12)]